MKRGNNGEKRPKPPIRLRFSKQEKHERNQRAVTQGLAAGSGTIAAARMQKSAATPP
jgi:hypothetical protein